MVVEAPAGTLPIYHDLEGIRTPLEFVEQVFHDVERYLSTLQRVAERTRLFLTHASGAEIGGVVKFPDTMAREWKALLTKTIEDLVEHQQRQVIFFWDEMPLMLHNLKTKGSEAVAMEILDVLRHLRQTHPTLRMVFTGSVGLHNVLSSLRDAGYANDPTNDMRTIDVPPLSPEDAKNLAVLLIEGEGMRPSDPAAVASAIAKAVDGIPFFVHHVVDGLVLLGRPAGKEDAEALVLANLLDPQDPWHLGYFVERIGTYYPADQAVIALAMLDALSASPAAMTFADLAGRTSAQLNVPEESLRTILTLLQRDHYVLQTETGQYRFRFPLLQKAWRFHRGLGL
jgi:hypothetical protein